MTRWFFVFGFILFANIALAAGEAPNVLFIAVDDLNDYALGLNPEFSAKTPHLSRLAGRGVLFTNAHCAAPVCNPSRVSVLTGVSPSTSGVYINKDDWREFESLKDIVTLPQHFRDKRLQGSWRRKALPRCKSLSADAGNFRPYFRCAEVRDCDIGRSVENSGQVSDASL